MARVLYSAEINELKGSVGGTTFQRNKSGTISKLKPSLVYNPTVNQVSSRQFFNALVGAWSALSFANKTLWNAFAASYQKYNYWGVQKNLSGFNWFLSINSNRLLCSLSQLDQPPTYETPLSAPSLKTFALSNDLSFNFDNFPEKDDYYLFVFATPPIRGLNVQSRRSLRLIKVIAPTPTLWHDVTAAWEAYYGLTWPPSSTSEAFNVLLAVSAVEKTTGISGQFNLSNQPLDLSTSPTTLGNSPISTGSLSPDTQLRFSCYIADGVHLLGSGNQGHIIRSADYGDNWSDLGQQFSQTFILSACYCGNGICLAGTSTGGKVLRSTDYGATWSDLGQQGGAQSIYGLTYLGNGICLAGTGNNGHIIRSTDYGATWSDLGQLGSEIQIACIANCGSGVLVCGTASGGYVYRSTDYGATWGSVGQPGSDVQVLSLLYIGNGIVIGGTLSSGKIIRSTDYGATWSDLGQQFSQAAIRSLAYLGWGVVFAGTNAGGLLLRSTDYGATWSNLGQLGSETYIYGGGYCGHNRVIMAAGLNSTAFILEL